MDIEIKIGRTIVTFTENDVFSDNGACVQCSTKRGTHQGYGRYNILLLTKKALRELETLCVRVPVDVERNQWNVGVEYFRYEEK